jgi:hypothetical protein
MNHPDVEPKIPAALRETVPLVARSPSRQPILCPHCAKRFFTPSGVERCFSTFAERPEPKSHAALRLFPHHLAETAFGVPETRPHQ